VQVSLNPLSDFGDFRSHWLRQTKLFFINISDEATLTQYDSPFSESENVTFGGIPVGLA